MPTRIRNTIKKIIRLLVEHYHPQKVILFGSYAYGTPVRDSDIDLLIIKGEDEKNRIERFVEVKRLIYNPKFKIPVSPLVLTKGELEERLNMGDDFIKEIISRGKLIYERQDSQGMA